MYGGKVPALDEIIDSYDAKELIAFREIAMDMGAKVKETREKIGQADIRHYVSQLMVWPLIETYFLWRKSINKQLASEEVSKIEELRQKQNALGVSDDTQQVARGIGSDEEFSIRFLNPYSLDREEFVRIVLSVKCDPLDVHIKRTTQSLMKIVHDSQMGGTIYIVGKDLKNPKVEYSDSGSVGNTSSAYSFLQRSFVCIDKGSKRFLFMDNIEGGCPYFGSLQHWRGWDDKMETRPYRDRVKEVFFAMASAMHMASVLGLDYIVPRDFELVEMARLLGIREKRVFEKGNHWKVGLHSEKAYTGVYTHSLYRGTSNNQGHQVRHPVMQLFPFKSPDEMMGEMNRIEAQIVTENWDRKTKMTSKTFERLNMMSALNDVIQAYPLSPQHITEQSGQAYARTLRTINHLLAVQ
jgi:hypothetical protein